jgi:hypothetical protein
MKGSNLIVVSAAWTIKAGRCSPTDMQYRKQEVDLRQVAALNEDSSAARRPWTVQRLSRWK